MYGGYADQNEGECHNCNYVLGLERSCKVHGHVRDVYPRTYVENYGEMRVNERRFEYNEVRFERK